MDAPPLINRHLAVNIKEPGLITRSYALGLGYGNIWLISSCLVFGVLDMTAINTNPVTLVLSILGFLLIGGALLFLCIKFLRLGYTLPKTGKGKASRTSRGTFFLLILLEIIGWSILIFCNSLWSIIIYSDLHFTHLTTNPHISCVHTGSIALYTLVLPAFLFICDGIFYT